MKISSLLLAASVVLTALGFYFAHAGNIDAAIPIMLTAALMAWLAGPDDGVGADQTKRLRWLEHWRQPLGMTLLGISAALEIIVFVHRQPVPMWLGVTADIVAAAILIACVWKATKLIPESSQA